MNDQLLTQVMDKLKERQQTELTVSYHEGSCPPSEEVFFNNGKLVLRNVSVNLVTDLYSMNKKNQWVNWVLTGIAYDVQFYFLINEQLVNFIPRTMIMDWPLSFVINSESLVIASPSHVITRAEIAAQPDKSFLVKCQSQLMTDEAVAICKYKEIKIKMRTEKNCIWRE